MCGQNIRVGLNLESLISSTPSCLVLVYTTQPQYPSETHIFEGREENYCVDRNDSVFTLGDLTLDLLWTGGRDCGVDFAAPLSVGCLHRSSVASRARRPALRGCSTFDT